MRKQRKPKAAITPGFVDKRNITEFNRHLDHATDILHPAMSEAGLTRDETKDFVHWMAAKITIALLDQRIRERRSSDVSEL